MTTKNNTKKGKAAELGIISDLIRNDFNVYSPMTDTEGIDFIIKGNRSYVEIQVKSRDIKNDEDQFYINDFEPKYNFFIICQNNADGNYYVLPSDIFYRHSKMMMIRGEKKRAISIKKLNSMGDYTNGEGLKLLNKAIKDPLNTLQKGLGKKWEIKGGTWILNKTHRT